MAGAKADVLDDDGGQQQERQRGPDRLDDAGDDAADDRIILASRARKHLDDRRDEREEHDRDEVMPASRTPSRMVGMPPLRWTSIMFTVTPQKK